MPSPALAALESALRARTSYQVDCFYEYFTVYLSLRGTYLAISMHDRIGELIYAAHLYPERTSAVRARYREWHASERFSCYWFKSPRDLGVPPDPDDDFDRVFAVTRDHLRDLAGRIATEYDVIGLTTGACQLFASLALARQIKHLSSSCRVVLGGPAVNGDAGAPILDAFSWVDHIVQGPGERPFLELLRAIEHRMDGTHIEQVLPCAHADGQPLSRTSPAPALDDLPLPDYRRFSDLAAQHGILKWTMPLQVSRAESSEPLRPGARKSPERIAAELNYDCDAYENVWFGILDPAHTCSSAAFGDLVLGLKRNVALFQRLRADLHPYDVLRLWEAGCCAIEIQTPGLSTSYLRRMGSDCSAIQNLQMMRICYELGINNLSLLITDFPTSTVEEVEETADNLRRYAIAYQPLEMRRFRLYRGTPVSDTPDRFSVTGVRNSDDFKDALPADIYDSLKLFWLDYDAPASSADWQAVWSRLDAWRTLHRDLLFLDGAQWFLGARALYYYDGGTFLKVIDRRAGHRDLTLDDLTRRLYMFCMEIRGREEIHDCFRGESSTATLDAMVAELLEHDVMFREGDQVLSLAVAYRNDLAVQRIRASAAQTATVAARTS